MSNGTRERIENQAANARKAALKSSSSFAETGKEKYEELCYRLMLLSEAEKVQEEATKLTELHDVQAYMECVRFFKNATNTNGPGVHKIEFRDSIREQDKKNPSAAAQLLPAFKNVEPQVADTEDLYKKKITDLINKICDYLLYHRERYVPLGAGAS